VDFDPGDLLLVIANLQLSDRHGPAFARVHRIDELHGHTPSEAGEPWQHWPTHPDYRRVNRYASAGGPGSQWTRPRAQIAILIDVEGDVCDRRRSSSQASHPARRTEPVEAQRAYGAGGEADHHGMARST
jgi:hypothetical protein